MKTITISKSDLDTAFDGAGFQGGVETLLEYLSEVVEDTSPGEERKISDIEIVVKNDDEPEEDASSGEAEEEAED